MESLRVVATLGSLGVLLGSPCVSAWSDEGPPSSPFVATMRQADGTVRIGGTQVHEHETRGGDRAPSRSVIIYSHLLQCGSAGPVLLGGSGRCSKVLCTLEDGMQGEQSTVIAHKIDAQTGKSLAEPEVVGIACRPTAREPEGAIESLIQRAFKTLRLPALGVRCTPSERTFVHLPTTFSVREPRKDHDLGVILGHRVTVTIRPVVYRWSFGDGTVRRTSAHGRHAPAASVRHSFERPTTAEASVRTTYRAKYRVDGGAAREIADPVSVDGPATVLPVQEARTELVAPPSR